MKRLLHFYNPLLLYRRFRLGAYLASIIRQQEGRAPTDAEYKAIAGEVVRRLP